MAILSEKLVWNNAEIISNILLKYFVEKKCHAVPCEWLYKQFNNKRKALLRNKVLTPIAYVLNKCCNYNDKVIDFRIHRYEVYIEAARELSKTFSEAGIKLVVIKTVKPLPTDIADIDIIVKSEDKIKAEKILKDLGYKLRKEGLRQDLWTKIVDYVIIDVELHTNIALAGFTYIEDEFIFNNTMVKDGINILNENIEIILEAAHAIIKDLEIKLSDILSIVFYLNNIRKEYQNNKSVLASLLFNAKSLGLTIPLAYISGFAKLLYPMLTVIWKFISKYSMVKIPVIRPYYAPIKPPIYLLIASLLEKSIIKSVNEGFFNTLNELLSILKSKGTDAIIAYFMGKTVTKDVFEDLVSKRHALSQGILDVSVS